MKFERTEVTISEASGRLPGELRVLSNTALLVQGITSYTRPPGDTMFWKKMDTDKYNVTKVLAIHLSKWGGVEVQSHF